MNKVLNPLVYQKAGWVLHMLRGQIGTGNFCSGIRERKGRGCAPPNSRGTP
jgi:aminopeptidase N